MAQIQAQWPISKQNGPNLARKPQFWPEVHYFGPLDLYCGLRYLVFDQIWPIFLWFGPFFFDLGPEDGARRTNRHTDGRTDRFPLCSTGLWPLWGPCPVPPQLKSHTTQGGHGYRWPLTAFGLLFSFFFVFFLFFLFFILFLFLFLNIFFISLFECNVSFH